MFKLALLALMFFIHGSTNPPAAPPRGFPSPPRCIGVLETPNNPGGCPASSTIAR